jgi:RHS repeat-associated protein
MRTATSNRLLGFTQSITSVRGTQTLSTVNSAVNYSLDAAGNLSSDGLRAFAYDATNRHTSTRSPAGADTATVQYLFNALGQRVFKSVVSLSSGTGVVSGGTNTTGSLTPMPTLGQFYSYADDSEAGGSSSASLPSYALLGEYCNGASGCVQQEYLWLPLDNGQAIPVGLLRSSRLYAIHTDHLGTPRLIHDDSNTPVWQWAYSAFGENIPTGALKATTNVNSVFALGANNAKLAVSVPGITVNLRFAGQYADSESNLYYNTNRSYCPSCGRYTQADPIGLEGGWSRFNYVGANSLSFFDPDGLLPQRYEKPPNPNKRPPPEHRTPSGDRERNVAHPDGEEHSKKPKGQRATRGTRGAGFATEEFGAACLRATVGLVLLLTPSPIACSELPENCAKYEQEE